MHQSKSRKPISISGEMLEDVKITEHNLELHLDEDATFLDFFNAYLALPMFPVRLQYDADTGFFEEFKHKLADDSVDNNVKQASLLKRFSFFKSTIDDQSFKIGYYIKFLERADGFAWIKENRLPLFLKSELYAEYKLARTLSSAQTEHLMNILIDSINLHKTAFDERSSPMYRTRRNNGRLPGLAEFQQQLQSLQGDNCLNDPEERYPLSDSDVSELEVLEYSEPHDQESNRIMDAKESSERRVGHKDGSAKDFGSAESKCTKLGRKGFEVTGKGQLDYPTADAFKITVFECMRKSYEDVAATLPIHFANEIKREPLDQQSYLISQNWPYEAGSEENAGFMTSPNESYAVQRNAEDGIERMDKSMDNVKNPNDDKTALATSYQARKDSQEESRQDDPLECKLSGNGEQKVHSTVDPVIRKRCSLPSNEQLTSSYLKQLSSQKDDCKTKMLRRQSLPFAAFMPFLRRESSASMLSTALQQMNELFSRKSFDLRNKHTQDTLRSFYEDSDSEDDSDFREVEKRPQPMDIASKLGMDAFKEFLVDTPGEKLLLLWIEIERLRSCYSASERRSIVQEIRQRFFKSGAAYEITSETMRAWKLSNVSDLVDDKLINIQRQVLEPLKSYWCARFTLHQKRKKCLKGTEYFTEDHNCNKSKCITHKREMTGVPQRPNTCFPNLRPRRDGKNREILKEAENGASLETCNSQETCYAESTRIKAHIRSKSAHPRLINTSSPKDVNLSQQQLQIVTTIDEKCGYRSSPYCTYRNDASSASDKAYVRLYIQPMPPAGCKATTVIRSNNKLPNEDGDANDRIMNSLIECLLHEKHSGNFFRKHLTVTNDQLALDCYNFWKALQDYNEHFFSESFSPTLIRQKAGFIFSAYIIGGSEHCIRCENVIQKEIHKALDPPYEDLFDKAEQHALEVLANSFRDIFSEESDMYEKVKKHEKLKYLDVRTKLRRPKHRPNEKTKDNDIVEDDGREKISIKEVNSPLPLSADGVTFDSFIRNRDDLESFKVFLEQVNSKGLKDLLAWTEMENFRRSSRRNDQRDNLAKSVHSNWLTIDYFFGPNSPATADAQEEVRKLANQLEIPDRPPSPLILEAQKYVRARIERRWFVLFKETPNYQSKHKENSINEMVEDLIMKRRLQRSEAAWKILNSRWVSGSRDVVALRKVLMDPVKCQRFRKFLSLKGDLMDHNVHFWLEVQKYKELCHRHVEDAIIRNKVQAIIDVFIKSAVPPELQIDVPIEIAERLFEKTAGRAPHHGPYLFREAQTTVFRIMFNHWKEFVTFRSSIEETKLSQHLEELVKKRKAELRAKRMNSERRRLARVAFEKRRKEKEDSDKFREKEKIKAENSSFRGYEKALSLISEDDEAVMQTRSFSYSKLTIEHHLNDFERRMREEGCTLDEFTEGELTQSVWNSDKKSHRRTSAMFADDQRSISGISSKTGKRKGEAVSRINMQDSLCKETILESAKEAVVKKTLLKANRAQKWTKKNPEMLSSNGNIVDSNSKKISSLKSRRKDVNMKLYCEDQEQLQASERISSASEMYKGHNMKMPGPQRTGKSLTMKSLKEFNRSSEGKPLQRPLPLIHITSMDTERRAVYKRRQQSRISRPSSNISGERNMKRICPKEESNQERRNVKLDGVTAKIIVT